MVLDGSDTVEIDKLLRVSVFLCTQVGLLLSAVEIHLLRLSLSMKESTTDYTHMSVIVEENYSEYQLYPSLSVQIRFPFLIRGKWYCRLILIAWLAMGMWMWKLKSDKEVFVSE